MIKPNARFAIVETIEQPRPFLNEMLKEDFPEPPMCPICSYKHQPVDQHRTTLQYQRWFLDRNGRLPTPEDTWAHCPPAIKGLARHVYALWGIDTKDVADPFKETERTERATARWNERLGFEPETN